MESNWIVALALLALTALAPHVMGSVWKHRRRSLTAGLPIVSTAVMAVGVYLIPFEGMATRLDLNRAMLWVAALLILNQLQNAVLYWIQATEMEQIRRHLARLSTPPGPRAVPN